MYSESVIVCGTQKESRLSTFISSATIKSTVNFLESFEFRTIKLGFPETVQEKELYRFLITCSINLLFRNGNNPNCSY